MESVQEATQGLDPFMQSAVTDLMDRHGWTFEQARAVVDASYNSKEG